MTDSIRTGQAVQLELTQTEAAFAKVRQDYIDAMIAADDPTVRDRNHAAIRVLNDVKSKLRAAVGRGKVAATQAD